MWMDGGIKVQLCLYVIEIMFWKKKLIIVIQENLYYQYERGSVYEILENYQGV